MIGIVYFILIVVVFIFPLFLTIQESSKAKNRKSQPIRNFSDKPLYPDEKPVIKETGPSKPADFPNNQNVYKEKAPQKPKIPDDIPVFTDKGPSKAKDFPNDVPVYTEKGASKQQDFPNYSVPYKTLGPSKATEFPDHTEIYKEPEDKSKETETVLKSLNYNTAETNDLLLKELINKETLLNNIIFLEILSKPVSMRKTR